jgi:hypothetical protein
MGIQSSDVKFDTCVYGTDPLVATVSFAVTGGSVSSLIDDLELLTSSGTLKAALISSGYSSAFVNSITVVMNTFTPMPTAKPTAKPSTAAPTVESMAPTAAPSTVAPTLATLAPSSSAQPTTTVVTATASPSHSPSSQPTSSAVASVTVRQLLR